MNFRSAADLGACIFANLHRLPRDLDLVIGVPRSGLLPATLTALALNLPIADLEGFRDGRLLSSGKTRRRAALDIAAADVRRALVIDDSIDTGAAMAEARKALEAARPDVSFAFCAIYGATKDAAGADLVLEVVPPPRVFQWNVMHHAVLARSYVDIDGVLCVDPTHDENDDGDRYRNFILNASPLNRPTRKIGALVTSRLEKYREPTEAWLAAHGVEYERLLMLDLPDAETRRRLQSHGRFKGELYRDGPADLFIESERAQAIQIAEISGKPVLCVDTFELMEPGALSPAAMVRDLRRGGPLAPVKAVARRILGEAGYRSLSGKLRARAGTEA
jgi:uncharacterized HAD superfamily protein